MCCNLSLFLIALTAIGLFGTSTAKDELVMVQALWRHGDRSPIGTVKSDLNQEDAWPQGWGQLSQAGMRQHVELGKRLREKYIEQLGFVDKYYHNHEVYVRSTDFNRTLISAISNFIGFYGPNAQKGIDYPDIPDWPKTYVPIAVHTVAATTDHIIPDVPCAREKALRELIHETPEYKSSWTDKAPFLEKLSKLCGEPITHENYFILADALFIEKYNNKTLPPWATDDIIKQINEINAVDLNWLNGQGLSKYKNVDFSLEIPRIRGGPMLWTMIHNMQDKMQCSKELKLGISRPKLRKSPLGSELCNWINSVKYFVYSAHDTSISSLLSAFGYKHADGDYDGLPHYAACITVELWRKKSNSLAKRELEAKEEDFYVKVFYWPGEGDAYGPDPVELTEKIVGCIKDCPMKTFVERSKPYEPIPSPDELCANLDGLPTSGVSKLRIQIWVFLLGTIFMFMFARVFQTRI